MSAAKLFSQHRNIYFWTFTFKGVEYDERAMWLWNQFQTRLKDFFGRNVAGLRVVEVHPAELSHGLHFHALLNRRLNIHIVKRLGKRWGFGRISVVKCDEGTAMYLAKYISKDNDVAPGIRRWACIGGFHGVKVKNVKCDSILSDNIKYCQNKMKLRQFGYAFFLYVAAQTMRYGKVRKWPTEKFILPSRAWVGTVKEVTAGNPDDEGNYYYVTRNCLELSTIRVATGATWKEYDTNQKPF